MQKRGCNKAAANLSVPPSLDARCFLMTQKGKRARRVNEFNQVKGKPSERRPGTESMANANTTRSDVSPFYVIDPTMKVFDPIPRPKTEAYLGSHVPICAARDGTSQRRIKFPATWQISSIVVRFYGRSTVHQCLNFSDCNKIIEATWHASLFYWSDDT